MKKIFLVIIIVIIAGVALWAAFWPFKSQAPEDYKEPADEPAGEERACVDSGGTVSTALCCGSTGDFPDNCAIGACGCAPEYSHQVKFCGCGEGKCFDGKKCVDSH